MTQCVSASWIGNMEIIKKRSEKKKQKYNRGRTGRVWLGHEANLSGIWETVKTLIWARVYKLSIYWCLYNFCSSFVVAQKVSKQLTYIVTEKQRQNIGLLLAKNRSVMYVQSVPITRCTINSPCEQHNCSASHKSRYKQATWHHRVGVQKCPDIVSIHLYVHLQKEHISITDLLHLLPRLNRLPYLWSVSDWLKHVTGWQPVLTDWSICFISIIAVRVIWFIQYG